MEQRDENTLEQLLGDGFRNLRLTCLMLRKALQNLPEWGW